MKYNPPLIQIIKKLSKEKSWSTKIFYGLVLIVCIFFVLKATVPSVQRICLKQFHLRNSFVEMVILQSFSWMYSFSNEVCWTDNKDPKSCDSFHERVYPRFHIWLNHNPLRLVTFTPQRESFVLIKTDQYIHLRSKYQNQEQITTYKIMVNKDNLYLKQIKNGKK